MKNYLTNDFLCAIIKTQQREALPNKERKNTMKTKIYDITYLTPENNGYTIANGYSITRVFSKKEMKEKVASLRAEGRKIVTIRTEYGFPVWA